jgi:hypothetical protein
MKMPESVCLGPALGSVEGRVEDGRGSLGHSATPRFPSPLIEPDVEGRTRGSVD